MGHNLLDAVDPAGHERAGPGGRVLARVQVERAMIKAAGRRLAVVRLPGRGGGGMPPPPLVFLHEGLGSITLWRGFPAALGERVGRAGAVYDRWGHGRSEPLAGPRDPGYLQDEATRFLPAVLDALEIPRAVLVGHSDGGTIALLFAAACPTAPPPWWRRPPTCSWSP
jgi:pimeloyl-ACP methyl ester carboxylesterase